MSSSLKQPEPGLTSEQLIERARALRPLLYAQQETNDRRGFYSDEIQQRLLNGGLYRVLQPKRFGGYELPFATFIKCIMELSRGHPGSGWCFTLAASHAFVLAAHWPEAAQRDLFGADGDFRAAMVLGPSGTLTPAPGGYTVDGVWPFASGIPVCNHFIAQAILVGSGPVPATALFVVPRELIEILPDWGGELAMGMQASGSNSVRVTNAFVPEHHVIKTPLPNVMMESTREGSAGTEIHKNPMYLGILQCWFHCEFAAIFSGTARAALDEYEAILRTKRMTFNPQLTRMHDRDNQRVFGEAMNLVDSAEALTFAAVEAYTELCRRWGRDGTPISVADSMHVWGMARNAAKMACDAVEILFQNAGASVAKEGQRLQRYFRDAQMYRVHIQSSPIWPTLRAANHLGVAPPNSPAG